MYKKENASNKNKLVLKYPASWWGNMWREALPSGNGRIGAAVYGAVNHETILINHEDLWHWGRKDPLPDVSYTLPEVRKLMKEGEFTKASWLLSNTLKDKEYNSCLASCLPLADIKVTMPSTSGFKHYTRSLDMETGEIQVKWMEGNISYQRSLFVSRSDDMIVYQINSNGGFFNADIRLSMHDEGDGSAEAKFEEIKDSLEIKAQGDFIYYAATNDDGTDYGALLRVLTMGGEKKQKEDTICLRNCEQALVLVKTFARSDRNKKWTKLKRELSAIDKSYDELFKSHVNIHKPLFDSVSISLDNEEGERCNEELLLEAYDGEVPTALVEKMWAYGRYLFISASRADGYPCSLYGLWGGDYNLIWCHNMANENVQMIYWHALAGGLTELMPALFNYYESMMEDFKENAKNLYGCRGIYIPAGSTPGIGVPNQIVPVIMNWTSAAGWLASHYYEYYLYTGDIKFLRDKALPFMRQIALFYEDFLELDDNGYYVYYPSVSPENTPVNFMPKSGKPIPHPMPTTINATMDFAIMKELLVNLIEGSETVSIYSDVLDKWRDMLSKIPPYQINEEGAVREWMHPLFDDRYEHRHLSHIYPVFPGKEITQETNPELFKAFDTAVRKRMLGAQSGWSLTHMACIYARLGDGEKALECLSLLSRSGILSNFYTLHNDWRNMGICMDIKLAPIQLDANMGWVNAVQEMLLYTSRTLVKIFPARPEKWSKGSVENLRFCTGKISFTWDIDKKMFEAVIYAERHTEIRVELPKEFTQYSWNEKEIDVELETTNHSSMKIIMDDGDILKITANND
jgi:alpha-L-fucosidase 2